ncbi:MAG TPA: hypothetical protein VGE90_04955, partial [Chitinophaga sp.]
MKPQIKKYIWIALLLIIFTEIAEWNTYAANTGHTDPYNFSEYIFLLLLSCFAYIVTRFSYKFCSRYFKHYGNTIASITAFFTGAVVFSISYPFYHSAYAVVMQGAHFWN